MSHETQSLPQDAIEMQGGMRATAKIGRSTAGEGSGKSRMRSVVGVCGIACWCVVSSLAVVADEVRVDVEDARPLAVALQELEARLGVPVSYEDAPYENDDDLDDATLRIRKDLDQFPPGEAPRILLPRVCRFEAVYHHDATGNPTSTLKAVESLVEAYNQQALPGKFRVRVDAGRIGVVPEQVMDRDGQWQPATVLLDKPVQVSVTNESLARAIQALYSAIDANTTAKLTGMISVPEGARVSISCSNEPARTVLARMLDACNLRNTRWVVYYQPEPEYYGCNISPVAAPSVAPTASPDDTQPPVVPRQSSGR